MCALAVIDLPFVAPAHAITRRRSAPHDHRRGQRARRHARSSSTASSSPAARRSSSARATCAPTIATTGSTASRSTSTSTAVRDRRRLHLPGRAREPDELAPADRGARPDPARQHRGRAARRATHTIDVVLEPYGTHGHEYAFYFPAPGQRGRTSRSTSAAAATIVAAAPARTLEVTERRRRTRSALVAAHLAARLASPTSSRSSRPRTSRRSISTRVAWRMRDRARVTTRSSRRSSSAASTTPTLWGYALLHHDRAAHPRVAARARRSAARAPGPCSTCVGLDAEDLGAYEHLEYAPLSTRAPTGSARSCASSTTGSPRSTRGSSSSSRIAARRSAEDLLAAARYLLAQDRIDDALALLARVDAERVADRLQHDYLAAYAACLARRPRRARASSRRRWRDHPVDRWRHRFGALVAMLDEIDGRRSPRSSIRAAASSSTPTSPRSSRRSRSRVDRDGVVVQQPARRRRSSCASSRWTSSCCSRASRSCRATSSRFSFIEPGHREQLASSAGRAPRSVAGRAARQERRRRGGRRRPAQGEGPLRERPRHHARAPVRPGPRAARLRSRGARRRPTSRSTRAQHGGSVAFYKDGYTDLRGWFDYATLSTNDLDQRRALRDPRLFGPRRLDDPRSESARTMTC